MLNVAKINTMDALIKALDVQALNDDNWDSVHDFHPDVDFSNDEHCEECDDVYHRRQEALSHTVKTMLGWANLEWDGTSVRPIKGATWDSAAAAIVDVINGDGMFEFRDAEHLVSVGPFASTEDAVCAHLHWLSEYPKVYCEGTVEDIFQRAL